MRKLLCFFSLIICTLCLCGCESNQEDRTKIFTALKNEKIISDSMKQIDTQTYSVWSFEWCSKSKYYIYKDKDSKMIAIEYNNKQHLKDNEYDHLVTIYYDVTINNDVNLINSEDVTCDENGYYSYQNGEYTDNGRYQFGTKKEYYATEKSALFKGKYYSLEMAK